MNRSLAVASEAWALRQAFRIARGAKTEAVVVVATVRQGDAVGRGECVPYARYGESVESVIEQIEGAAYEIRSGLSREDLQARLPAGAARNALDCALIDLEAKASGRPAHEILGLPAPATVQTTFTLSVDEPARMGQAAAAAAANGYGLLKLKVAGGDDIARVEAVRNAAPHARLIVDANEGWAPAEYESLANGLARLGVVLIEQPLKAAEDDALAGAPAPVALCADESCHTRADLDRLVGRYAYINIKLDKAGGLTEAAALMREAQQRGMRLMIGCMVATSLAMAPALLLAGAADFIDLDGPLLLARDRSPGLRYERDRLFPPSRDLWG